MKLSFNTSRRPNCGTPIHRPLSLSSSVAMVSLEIHRDMLILAGIWIVTQAPKKATVCSTKLPGCSSATK